MEVKNARLFKWKNKWVAYSESGQLLCMVRSKDVAISICNEYKVGKHLRHRMWTPTRNDGF